MSPALERRQLGTRGVAVTRLGLGCAPLGNLFASITDEQAVATVDAAWEAGIRYFDTAPLYGSGLSEQRLGRALASRPRDEFVVSTKVGRLLRPSAAPAPSIFPGAPPLDAVFDFGRDAVLASFESSLQRLGLDRVDVVLVHDPDDHEGQALAEAFPALLGLRDQGVIGAVGCGMNQAEMLARLVRRVDLDCILLAGRYTLLDRRGAEELLPLCAERGVGVVLGGIFNSGLLASPAGAPTFDYAPAPAHLVERAAALEAQCRVHGCALGAAAVQFGLRHPAVTSVLVGARSPAEITQDVSFAAEPLPDALWPALDAAANRVRPQGFEP